tara:strand:+ start:700 stop:879 length:180 start_codon:yes stop_codon:yes gene_type:complete
MANQGPSSPIKYYPDARGGRGGYMQNTGGGRPGSVRLKAKARTKKKSAIQDSFNSGFHG